MSLDEFQKKISEDSSFASKIQDAQTPDAVIQIAKEAGIIITLEDLEEGKDSELDNQQLSEVSGGMGRMFGKFGSFNAKTVTTREDIPECTAKTVSTREPDEPACGSSKMGAF